MYACVCVLERARERGKEGERERLKLSDNERKEKGADPFLLVAHHVPTNFFGHYLDQLMSSRPCLSLLTFKVKYNLSSEMKATYFTFTPHVIQPKSFTDNSDSVQLGS